MESQKKLILGFNAFAFKPFATDDQRIKFLSSKFNPHGRLLLALIQYLQQYTKYFDRIDFAINYEQNIRWSNGTLGGLVKKINDSEIDVGVSPLYMNEDIVEKVDFSYPYELQDYTFINRKPEYKPQIFGIFQTFSLSVWISIISVLITMPIASYTILKGKYSFNNTFFHVFAILMKQNSIIRPSSLVEKLLVYSWVIGAMILCLSYDSVFVSFLSIPPVTKIKTLSDLALAVESDDYHCISNLYSGITDVWKQSKQENLRTIAIDIIKNELSYGNSFANFLRESQKQNLAFILDTKYVDIFAGIFSLSEDQFSESMPGMMVRKGSCCKELLDSFVHKIMASGLYFKIFSDESFLSSMWLKSEIPDNESTIRKLTLTDVAPAFIFLLTGYFISFLVLLIEIGSNSKNRNYVKESQKRKKRKVYDETPVKLV